MSKYVYYTIKLKTFVVVYVQESVEMRKMETSVSSTIPIPGSGLENQGRAASMPRLNAGLQVLVVLTFCIWLALYKKNVMRSNIFPTD